jgi:hypothetical protein
LAGRENLEKLLVGNFKLEEEDSKENQRKDLSISFELRQCTIQLHKLSHEEQSPP